MKKGIEGLQEEIKRYNGIIISNGTHLIDKLLSEAYDIMTFMEFDNDICKNILEVFHLEEEIENSYLGSLFYYGKAHIKSEKRDEAERIFNEDVFQYFNEVAPDGFYFGASEGNGSLFGWFKIDEESV